MRTKERRTEKTRQMRKTNNAPASTRLFEKIPRFDGTNPSYCFDWLEQTEALVNEHQGRVYREELLLNCSTSVAKTIHTLPQEATNQQIKDAILRNHSNLRTVSQHALVRTNSFTRNQTKHYRHITPDTHHISTSPTQNWK